MSRVAWLKGRSGWKSLRIRFHPLFLVLVIAAVGVGLWQDVLILFLIVMMHELGHAAMANHLGYEVEEVSLLPFGGVAKLGYGSLGFNPTHEAFIAIAGPFVNLVLVLLAWLMHLGHFWTDIFYEKVLIWNLWIVVFNLLPGLPLDGGRVLRAARSRSVGYEQATREAYRVALWLSVILLCSGGIALWAGSMHFGMLLLGVFLFVSAWTGRRDTSIETIRFLDAKRKQNSQVPIRIQAVVAPAEATVKDVVRTFAPDRYHMVYVQNELGSVQTVLEEDEMIQAAFDGRYLHKMRDWLLPPDE